VRWQILASVPISKDESEHAELDSHWLNWRSYVEDLGNDPVRDYGTPDPFGGTACAYPPIGGVDNSNSAASHDQYATRHNPFVYFHSVIDAQARCDSHVVLRVEPEAIAPIVEFMGKKPIVVETIVDNSIVDRLVCEGFIEKLFRKR